MSTTTVDSGTDLLWRSYAKQITQKLAGGGDLGDRNAIFVCPLTTQAIASGTHIPTELTNNQLSRAVDSLLDASSPVYVPGEGSYFDTVSSYLRHVLLVKNPGNEAIIRLTHAENESKRAQAAYNAELAEARVTYLAAEGVPAPRGAAPLELWAQQNYPSLIGKKDALQAATNSVMQIQAEINGPAAVDLNKHIQNCINAGNPSMSFPGFNMPCVEADIDNIEANRSGTATKPEGIFYRPSYSLQGYSSQVDDWIRMPKTQVADSITFSIAEGRSSSWASAGFRKVEAKANASAWCFLRASASTSATDANANLSLDAATSSLEVTITFKGLKAFPIGTGRWDVSNLKHQYPDLAPNSPPELIRDLVRPERILIGHSPGMTVKFDAATYHKAQTIMSHAQSTSASVSLFGFCIGGSASADTESSGATAWSSVAYNAAAFTMTIPPLPSTFPICVGVLAKKL